MEEKETAAAPIETPVVDTADSKEAPAETPKPSPEPERATKAELVSEISSLRAEVTRTREEALESGRRAQRAADSHASRLEKRIERLSGLLDEVATRGLEEPEVRAWRYRQEAEREREKAASYDADAAQRRAEEEFRSYSAQVLAEEQVDRENPVFKEAWARYGSQARDSSDWKAALNRAVADVRKDEARRAREEATKAADKAREDERARQRNQKREAAGPTPEGAVGSTSRKKYMDMTDEEFEADSKQKKAERDRRLMRIGR